MNELNPNWDVSAETMGGLMEENAQLKARVARLEEALSKANKHSVGGYYDDVLNEAPQQSLAHIQAEAVEKAVREVRQQIPADNEFGSIDACYTYKLINYAADVRQQADKG